jgi:CheY-like chemotaxis protein/anti-sigma regulatory factor (Ser/Thr protein kinase)
VYDLKNLKQILINLLSNALKYTDSGSVSLSVYKEKKNLVFHIKDSGKGMTEEDKKHIWQAFKRGSSSSKETMSTGLGLAIVKNLIDDLNGEISFTSEKNKGTEFRVTLKPQLEQNQEISETEKKKTHPFENIPVKGIHILLAEDENIIRIITTKLLKKQGALITATENGEELLEIFQKKSSEFDIIITDIEMPKKNGKEVIQEVRKISNIPLITLSAHAFKELEEEFKVLGANSTLTKPLHAEILQREIRILYWTKKFEEEHIFHTLFEKYISLSEEERKKFYNLSNYVKKNIIKDLYQLSERLEKFLENKEEPQSCEDIFTLISSLQEICLQEQVQNLFDLLKDIEQNINSTGEINLLLYLLQNSLKNLDENSSL